MIYLDNAATTLPKPHGVHRAVQQAMERMASPGRGGHKQAMRAAEAVFACREQAARMFEVEKPEHVVFTFNATHGLNIAIKSLVRPGSTVLISGFEHNAVLRPLLSVEKIQIRVAKSPLFRPDLMLQRMEELMSDDVSVVICTHVSNVFGFVLPIEGIAALCRKRNKALIVDASQSAGCLPVSMREWGAKFIALPGHKGLYGPQGTGMLLCSGESVKPLLEGGTGSASASLTMPEILPDRLEAGTHNVPGIAGLLAGMRFVERCGPDKILQHERSLVNYAAQELSALSDVEVYCAPGLQNQAGVLSFRTRSSDCEEIGEMLGDMNIAVRAGLHCAPLAHRTAGTFDSGTVRIGLSVFNQKADVEQFVKTMKRHFSQQSCSGGVHKSFNA